MDRLICGDVGYGKTEVAMRAALKAVAGSKQVMVLVPTTILAQQHLGTFSRAPARVPGRGRDGLAAAQARRGPGRPRAVRGRQGRRPDRHPQAASAATSAVRELGLLVVDEEQRFGVRQKELLRQLKLKVDVLSLSATPIPRTLQMSLAGLRDVSVIETPPEGRRPIRTYVGPFDEELVARAIKREAERGGQTFFLHNRIDSLHGTAERLRALCPGFASARRTGRWTRAIWRRR